MQPQRHKRVFVVAGGDVSANPVPAKLVAAARAAALVIAADGGLRNAQALGLSPAVFVGDGDSVSPSELDALAARGVEVLLHERHKDASDTELAVRQAALRGATEIYIIGALGGLRFDHALANLLLLASPDIDAHVALVDGRTTAHVVGRHGAEEIDIAGAKGDYVSLLPLSDEVSGVTTAGLVFPLAQATLHQGPTLGLSNQLATSRAKVSVDRGRLAVIHTRTGDAE